MRATFILYGPILAGVLILFCYLRRRFPRPYNLRNWVEDIKTPIAANQYGFISWMWGLNVITEDEILSECGLDALCFLRLLIMGYKIAVLSCFNAIWLLPLYATAPTDAVTELIMDPVVKLTIANVPDGSIRCIGTVIAAYILFGYICYLILKVCQWKLNYGRLLIGLASCVHNNYVLTQTHFSLVDGCRSLNGLLKSGTNISRSRVHKITPFTYAT